MHCQICAILAVNLWSDLYDKPSRFWSLPSNEGVTLLQKMGIRLLSLIHGIRINHWLTCVFDGIGLGVNSVLVPKTP